MKVIHDDFVPGRKGGAWVVKRGQFIKVTDVDGGAIGNFVTFNANNLKERLDQGRTKADNGKFLISKGITSTPETTTFCSPLWKTRTGSTTSSTACAVRGSSSNITREKRTVITTGSPIALPWAVLWAFLDSAAMRFSRGPQGLSHRARGHPRPPQPIPDDVVRF